MTLRVAIIGAGNWSANHIASWNKREDAEITWIVRSSEERAAASAARHGVANASGSFRDVLAHDDIDLVDILLPHDLHAEATVLALRHGKHVLLEKPIAPSLQEAETIAAAAREAGRVVMIAENWVYATVVRRAQQLIEEGAIGRPFLVRSATELDVRHMFVGNSWRNDAAHMGGGVLMDGGTHNISVCRHLLGEIAEVSAAGDCFTYPDAAPLEDTAALLLRFASGALGVMTTTIGAQVARPSTAFAVLGTEGTIEFDTHADTVVLARSGQREETVFPAASRGFDEQIEHFLDCVRSGRAPRTDPADQIRSLKAVLAAYRSMDERRMVAPEEGTSVPGTPKPI